VVSIIDWRSSTGCWVARSKELPAGEPPLLGDTRSNPVLSVVTLGMQNRGEGEGEGETRGVSSMPKGDSGEGGPHRVQKSPLGGWWW